MSFSLGTKHKARCWATTQVGHPSTPHPNPELQCSMFVQDSTQMTYSVKPAMHAEHSENFFVYPQLHTTSVV